jgi:hypothetical protein
MQRFRVRSSSIFPVVLCLAALQVGCGDDPGPLPEGCTRSSELLASLRGAPGQVRLSGERLSDCFQKGADAGQIQAVGGAFVEAASRLSSRARPEPEGRAAVQLGYLVGAARRGGSRTSGVHDELLRRLDQEAGELAASSRSYRRGRRAGQEAG